MGNTCLFCNNAKHVAKTTGRTQPWCLNHRVQYYSKDYHIIVKSGIGGIKVEYVYTVSNGMRSAPNIIDYGDFRCIHNLEQYRDSVAIRNQRTAEKHFQGLDENKIYSNSGDMDLFRGGPAEDMYKLFGELYESNQLVLGQPSYESIMKDVLADKDCDEC